MSLVEREPKPPGVSSRLRSIAGVILGQGEPRALLLFIGVVVLLLGPTPLASAKERFAGLEFSFERLFPNWQQGPWVPMQLEVENLTSQSRRLEVQLITKERGRAVAPLTWELTLSPNAVKHEILPCHLPFRGGWFEAEVVVREDGRRLSPPKLTLPLRMGGANQGAVNVLIIVPDERTSFGRIRDSLNLCFGNAEIVPLVRERAPARPEVYSAVDQVVLVGLGPEDFSEGQRRAIQRAVRSGVTAWMLPGSGGEGSGWVSPPGSGSEPISRITRSLAGRPVDVFLWPGEEDREEPSGLRHQDRPDFPRVLEYAGGLGRWYRVTVPGEYPFFNRRATPWPQSFPLLRSGSQGWRWRSPSWVPAIDSLFRTEVSLELVFLLMLVYLFVVGPLLFFLLKRKGRLIWLLWLQPIVVCGFVTLVYFVGYVNFGIPSASQQTVIVHQPLGAQWGYGAAIFSHYNSVARRKDLRAGGGTLPTLVTYGDEGREQGWRVDAVQGSRLEDFYFPTWSLTHFSTEGPVQLGGTLRVEVVTDDAGELAFEVHNGLPFSVSDPVFPVPSAREVGTSQSQSFFVRFRQNRCWHPGVIEAGARRVFPISSCESLFSLEREVSAEAQGWLELRRELWDNAETPLLLVDFDASRVAGIDFSIEGEKDTNRGLLILVKEAP